MRSTNIRKAILTILERAQPYALPEAQLITEINGRIRPRLATIERLDGTPHSPELDDEILALQQRRAIATVPDPLDENLIKWAITEAGMTLLRN